jgi:hypothetical protein
MLATTTFQPDKESKHFFFEKKKQKTYRPLSRGRGATSL